VKVSVSVTVRRDDGTTLTQEVSTGTERVWVPGNGVFQRETKAQVRKRLDRMVTAAINATMGRA
jgi:hypothetical protein